MATAPPAPRADAPLQGFEFRPELVAHARRSLGRENDAAEDIVQEAYVHLLRRAREGNPPREARPWLYTVVSSLCIRERARARRQPPSEMDGRAASSGDPARVAELNAELRWALASVADLPAREQATLIADLAGLTQGHEGANARYQALHRARRKLRTLRAEAWGLLPFPSGIGWTKLLGSGQAGVAAGAGGAPAAVAAGGIAKGVITAAAAVVALGGGQMLASIPADRPAHAAAYANPAQDAALGRPPSPAASVPAGGRSGAASSRSVAVGKVAPAGGSPPAGAPGAGPSAAPTPVVVPTPPRPLDSPGPPQSDAPQPAAEAAGRDVGADADGVDAPDPDAPLGRDEDDGEASEGGGAPVTDTEPADDAGVLDREVPDEDDALDEEGEQAGGEIRAPPAQHPVSPTS